MIVLSALAGFGVFVAVDGLVTTGDAAAAARDIVASESLFRLGIASLFAVIALDVVVAWGLVRVFAHVDAGISRLAGWLRLAYSAVFMVAITELTGALRLLGDGGDLSAFTTDQLHTQAVLRIEAFSSVFDAALVLFGLHLIVAGYLAFRSAVIPKVLGVLLAVAGVGYLVDSFTAVLGSPTNLGAFTFIGEFLLAVWLVTRSRKFAEATLARSQPTSPALSEPPREPAARTGARQATVAARRSATR